MTEYKTESLENNFFKEISMEIKNRIKSKIIFSYLFSWIILNWKTILYLFLSDDSIEVKIKVNNPYIVFSYLGPFIGVFIYIVVIPPISILMTLFTNWITKRIEIRKIKQELDLKAKELQLRSEYIENRNNYYKAKENEPLILKLEKQIEILEKESKENEIKINLYEERLAIDSFKNYDFNEKKEAKQLLLLILSNDYQRIPKTSIKEDNKVFFKLFRDGFIREGTQNYYLTETGKILANRIVSGQFI